MRFFHIVVETSDEDKNGQFIKVIEYDRTDLEEIRDEIIRPYILKDEILVDGSYLEFSQIRSLKIKETERDSSKTVDSANNNIPPNVIIFLSTEDVISSDGYTTDLTRNLIKEVRDSVSKESKREAPPVKLASDNKKVFVVHGHDDAAKSEIARFLEKAGLEPIVLHEQASSSRTIIEKIEANSDVGYAVILYTPCDIGAKKTESPELKSRARQNVVFEHGYFIGRIGRPRVSAFLVDGVEAPNDISGVVYIDLDLRGGWKLDLAKELQEAGYTVEPSALL
ncbi:MAG: TIR domain-containing protein [Pseudomonadota bacterium]